MKDHRLCTLVDVSTIATDASIKGILNNQTQGVGPWHQDQGRRHQIHRLGRRELVARPDEN
jgi:hypothetical protein